VIVNEIAEMVSDADPSEISAFLAAHVALLAVHSKVLACHSECLGMNAENMSAAVADLTPPYGESAYMEVMRKWELVDKEGRPII